MSPARRLLPLLCLLLAGACQHGAFQTSQGGATPTTPLIVNIALPGSDEESDLAVALAMEELHVPSVSLALIEGGKVAWTRTWGEDITPATPFQAGSMSQPVSAAAALALVEEGYLTLDDDVGRWVEGWRLKDPEHPVTLRNLLSMASGLAASTFQGYPAGAPPPTLAEVIAGAPPANSPQFRVLTVPGTAYADASSGYVIVEVAMQGATGVDFAEIARARVLVPAGMNASSFEQPPGDTLAVIAASGHDGDGREIDGRWRISPEQAAAGLWSTPSDLAAFMLGLGEAQAGRPGLLGEASAAQMFTAQNGGPWGLGFALGGSGSTLALHKRGRASGYTAYMIFFPATGQGAVVMTGGDNGAPIVEAILAGLGQTYLWPWDGVLVD